MTDSTGARLRSPIRTVADVDRFVLALVRDDPRPYHERAGVAVHNVQELLTRLAHPERELRFVHIAGSKGKGSVALMLEALLAEAGVNVATFTSPHLRRWNERFRIHGAPVDDRRLVATMERVRSVVLEMAGSDDAGLPSFFETLTAAALELFRDAGCRVAILECGLGGRYDATNAITPEVGCITSIEYEHVDKLGATLAEIAWHKAGIAKRGVPLVCAQLPEAARRVIADEAASAGAPLFMAGDAFDIRCEPSSEGGYWVQLDDDGRQLRFRSAHPSVHMADNAALACVLARHLGVTVDPDVLTNVVLPARAQTVSHSPRVIVDGAHTQRSLAALDEHLRAVPASRRRFLLASSGSKQPDALAALVEGAELVVVTAPDALRSTDAEQLRGALLDAGVTAPVSAIAAPRSALTRALDGLADDGLLCITGSVYLAGWALEQLAPEDRDAG